MMNAPIVMHQRADERTRTPNSGCEWVASTVIDGIAYQARSRHGAPNELARQLVEAGIADAPVDLMSDRGPWVALSWPSLHRMAEWTYEENAQGLRRRRWRPFGVGAADLWGSAGKGAVTVPPAAFTPTNAPSPLPHHPAA